MNANRAGRAVPLALVLFAVSFLARIANYGFVFVGGLVRFPSGRDELYHVRRIVYEAARFPATLDFDPYVSFPFGARPLWPPFLDWLLAGLARLLVGGDDPALVETLIAWLPPLFGAATVVVVGELGRRFFSLPAGLAAGLLLALMPTHHVHSQLGQVDHQVVVGLVTVLLLAATMALLASPARSRSAGRLAALAGALVAANLMVSPGALLQILPLQATLVAWVLWAPDRSLAVSRARHAAALHGVAAALLAPACFGNGSYAALGEYSPLVLSNFQPLWFAAAALALLALAALWQRSRSGATRATRVGSAALLAGLGAALALAVPGFRDALAYAGGWFTHQETFLDNITELQPLLFPHGRFDPSFALGSLTPALLAFPLAWLWLVLWGGLALNARPATALLLIWSAAFLALSLSQERFANVFAPGLALTIGVALAELGSVAGQRFGRGVQRALAAVLAVALLAALARPAIDFSTLFAHSRFARSHAGAAVPLSSRPKVVIEQAARWLRENTPPTRGFGDASLRPEYAVLTSWDDGHLVRYRAERPTVQDNFGPFGDRRAFDLARDYFASEDEAAAYRTALELGARYTIASYTGSGQTLEISAHSLAQRLWRRLGNAEPGRAGAGSAALARHRLIWTGDLSGRPRDVHAPATDRVAIFEIVPGAWVEGEATPVQRVSFDLALEAGGGQLRYRAHATASAEGRYGLRLPYPTDVPVSSEVRASADYRVRAGEREVGFALAESAIAAGATVSGPSLR